MKTKLLLLLAMSIGLVSSAWAEDVEISNASELVEFAERVNDGEFDLNAVLTDDIDMSEIDSWTPIGSDNEHGYKGTFDGKGFTISGFELTSSTTNNSYGAGFFGHVVGGANIKDFTIYGTITSTGQRMGVIGSATGNVNISGIHSFLNITCTQTRHGGILGAQVGQGTINITNCSFSGSLTTKNISGNFGGIVGLTLNNTSAYINIVNCLFDGTIDIGTGDNAGGFVGYTRSCNLKIENCLSVGTITANNPGQFVGQINSTSKMYFAGRNYYTGGNVQGTGTAAPISSSIAPTQITESQLASGEICFLLNGSVSGGENWFQSLIDDKYPTPYGSDKVYANASYQCDGVTPKGDVTYGNKDEATVDDHSFNLETGLCANCSYPKNDWLTANGEGYYEIGTPAQLKWFAVYVNQVNPAVNAVLTDNIDLTGVAWIPIGNAGAKYTGIFDGQGFAITNFSYTATGDDNGLFGYVKNANIKDFSISGTLTSDGYTRNGTIGGAEGNSVISGICSALNINVSNFKGHTGGILGSTITSGNKTRVENCEYSGTLIHSGAGDCQAGILGYTYDGGVFNCIFSGTIKGENNKYGGILGYCKVTGFLGIQNCLSIGKIVANDGCTTAAAIIANWNSTSATENVKNNYYCLQEGSTTTIAIGNHPEYCEAPVAVTTAQLTSGEVAYKLGEDWGQLLDADPYPTPSYDVKVNYVGEAGYATMYDETSGYELIGDVKAYVAVPNKNYPNLILTKIDNVPASTPVILKGTYYNKVEADLKSIDIDNVLKGAATDVEAEGKYILAKPAEKEVGFYLAETGTIKAGKAYIELDGNAGVKAFFFAEDGETAINNVNVNDNVNNAAIYNIAGQKLSKLQKGINIVNGRKVLY